MPKVRVFLMIPAGVLVLLIMASLALYWLPGGVHSDSTSLVEVGIFDTPGFGFGVAVTGDLALVADGDSGLRVINISDPTVPVGVGFVDTPVLAIGVAVTRDLVLVADGSSGWGDRNLGPSEPY